MRFAAAISALAFASVAVAQNQIIKVGEADGTAALQFTPSFITANEGDVITFVFDAPNTSNHTITQSSFAAPCEPVAGGFSSGFVSGSSAAPPSWSLTITNASAPIWFFCAQTNPKVHCNAGMVGAINAPTSGKTFSAFQAAAEGTSGAVQPTAVALTGVGAAASAAPTATGTAPASSGSGSSTSSSAASTASTSSSAASPASTGTSGTSSGSASPASSGGSSTSTRTSSTSTSAPPSTSSPSSAGQITVSGLVAAVAAAFGVAIL